MELNMKELTAEEITTLIAKLKDELKSREAATSRLVVYAHDCYDASNYHKNKYKHWCKLIKGIDDTKVNGYAFMGPFLCPFSENKVEIGSIVVEVCNTDYTAYKITGDNEKEKICKARRDALSKMIAVIKEQCEEEVC